MPGPRHGRRSAGDDPVKGGRRCRSFREVFDEFDRTESDEAFEAVVAHPACDLASNISRCSAIVTKFEGGAAPVRFVEGLMFNLMAMELVQ